MVFVKQGIVTVKLPSITREPLRENEGIASENLGPPITLAPPLGDVQPPNPRCFPGSATARPLRPTSSGYEPYDLAYEP